MSYLKGNDTTNVWETAMEMSQYDSIGGLIYYLRNSWPEDGPIRIAFEKYLKDNRSTEVLKGICLAGGNHLGTKMNLVTTYLVSEGLLKDIRY